MRAVPERSKEFTLRALFLGAALSALLAAANAYLGLFAGMTISGSIPAAVVSMVVLRAVRGTLLENNLVQTAASAGESVAAGAIFTLPALVFVGAWSDFDYLSTLGLLVGGGVLGTVFTIPLRRVLLEGTNLPFPEGVATARVLTAGHSGQGAKGLGYAALVGGAFKLSEGLLGVFATSSSAAFRVGSTPFLLSVGLSPALAAVGAIVGVYPSLLVAAGGAFNWLFVIPWVAAPTGSVEQACWSAWSEQTRFLGVGAMAVGGVVSTFAMGPQIRQAFHLLTRANEGQQNADLPRPVVLGLASLASGLVFIVGVLTLGSVAWASLVALLALVTAFLFSAVASYMAGLVGSSNNPVSGVTLATLLVVCAVLLLLGGESQGGFERGPMAALVVAGAVCTSLAIAGDTIQDLKAGALLGAKPRYQELAQLLGVLAAALVLGPVLSVLSQAYGFGAPTAAHPEPLRAPQATLMAAVAQGFFGGDLPWRYVSLGGLLATVLAFGNVALRRGGRREVPILAVAIGLYLPFEISLTILLGALAARGLRRTAPGSAPSTSSAEGEALTLVAAGLISGEALAGLVAALAIVGLEAHKLLRLGWLSELLGLLALLGVLALLARVRGTSARLPEP